MTVLSRRSLLTASSAAGLFAQEGENPGTHSPDANLIRLCAEHTDNLRRWVRNGGSLDLEECPWHEAYACTRRAVTAARPRTMAGVVAKARVAVIEAGELNGTADPKGTSAAGWAWDLVQDLLRLEGRA